MGAFKKFLSSDLIVTPFEVNKSFSFTGAAAFTGSDVGIDRFLGKNILNDFFTSGSNPQTGEIQRLDQELVYNSTKQLYYTNYLSSSYGDTPSEPFIVPGLDETGDIRIGSASSAGRFENYLQTTLRTEHYFPTESNAVIGVISIPTKLYGERIQPGTFSISAESGSITDDGNGGLYQGDDYVGNIIYQHGLAILTNDSAGVGSSLYGVGIYGTASYGTGEGTGLIDNIITSSNAVCSFSSSYTLFETQYKCTVDSNEFSFTLNPTVISGSTDGTVYDFATGSYFDPYVTTVGLYNEAQDLIAVAKLGKPLPLNSTTDTNIIINIDR
jgi:hypothetical protein